MASFKRTYDIADELFNRFNQYGFKPEFHKYDVLLSLPDPEKNNHVAVFNNSSGNKIFQNMRIERIIEPNENDSTALPPFLAYGKNGEVKVSLTHFVPGSLKISGKSLQTLLCPQSYCDKKT